MNLRLFEGFKKEVSMDLNPRCDSNERLDEYRKIKIARLKPVSGSKFLRGKVGTNVEDQQT